RMSWTVFVLDIRIVLAVLIGVVEKNADGGAVCPPIEHSRPDLRDVFFFALGDDLRLPRPAAAQVGQQILNAQRQAGRTAVNDCKVAGTVADAGRGDAKQ